MRSNFLTLMTNINELTILSLEDKNLKHYLCLKKTTYAGIFLPELLNKLFEIAAKTAHFTFLYLSYKP